MFDNVIVIDYRKTTAIADDIVVIHRDTLMVSIGNVGSGWYRNDRWFGMVTHSRSSGATSTQNSNDPNNMNLISYIEQSTDHLSR